MPTPPTRHETPHLVGATVLIGVAAVLAGGPRRDDQQHRTPFGAIVIDGYTVIGDNALALTHIGEFNIHPNDAGYAAIAKAHRRADRGR